MFNTAHNETRLGQFYDRIGAAVNIDFSTIQFIVILSFIGTIDDIIYDAILTKINIVSRFSWLCFYLGGFGGSSVSVACETKVHFPNILSDIGLSDI
ncbi:hypothetical protein KUH03_41585 [Sphingobacterium sp. E70]|uniref:hypothetical protein n=1 Tax=Sphingobacterium sp. E70 TaxID=2853439 RepID=UPI00211D03F9|nr:hypothetical protein [Sphingobacterium sp. E70]ULT25244.1 hypothetical protein KUH03_41585 [Sphingobacterium sp. E70]